MNEEKVITPEEKLRKKLNRVQMMHFNLCEDFMNDKKVSKGCIIKWMPKFKQIQLNLINQYKKEICEKQKDICNVCLNTSHKINGSNINISYASYEILTAPEPK